MASISKRTRQDGHVYEVVIRKKKKGKIVLRETRIFSAHKNALTWSKKREAELDNPEELQKAIADFESGVVKEEQSIKSVADLIDRWVEEEGITKTHRRTYYFDSKLLKHYDIVKLKPEKLTAVDLIKFTKARAEEGVKPQTINHNIATIRSAFRHAIQMWHLDLNMDAFETAVPKLKKSGAIKKSDERDRRVTDGELKQLLNKFEQNKERLGRKATSVPMSDIVEFAIYSCMRVSEIVRIEWKDLDEEAQTVVIRDRKSPVSKIGNHDTVVLLPPAFEIVMRQPRTDARIFPFGDKTITANFRTARNACGIEDLTFHDFRHEGTSRLFEKGFSIPEVASVTGHRNWQNLKRYTQLMPKHMLTKWNELEKD
jgi:integrase